MSSTVLLTGEHGYLGSVVRPVLEAAGHRVVALDSYLFDGCDFGTVDDRPHAPRDVRDITARDLEGIDHVVHLAALSNDPLGDLDPALTRDVNLSGSTRLARIAREAGVRRFVFASSCSMYGAAPPDEEVDEESPLRPLTPYAESKARFEDVLRELADGTFEPVSMRNATAYGVSPRLRLDIVVNNLTAWAHATGEIKLTSSGASWRPLVHVDDIAASVRTVLEADRDEVAGAAFNIGRPDQNYLVSEVADLVHAQFPSAALTRGEAVGVDPRSYRVSFDRFARTFPEHVFSWDVAAGIAQLASAYQRHGLRPEDLRGDRFIRLNRLRARLADHSLAADLRPTGIGRP